MALVRSGGARFRVAGTLVVALVLVSVGAFQWQLWRSQGEERSGLTGQTERRAAQLVNAVAERLGVLVRSVDFVLLQVRRDDGTNGARLGAVARSLLDAFPERLLLEVSFANAEGETTYSSLGPVGKVNIRERAHFKAHLDDGDRLFVGKPLKDRVSNAWTIQFSRPIVRNGRFAGVAVLSLAPEYVSRVLATFELSGEDVVILADTDGTFLARSQKLEDALGKSISPARPFMRADAAQRGLYRATSFVDGFDRIFAWQRLPQSGLVAVVGLDTGRILAPLEAHDRQERLNGAMLSGALVALGAALLLLMVRLARRHRDLARSEARFRSLAQLSSDWYWEQDRDFRVTTLGGNLEETTGISNREQVGKTHWDLPALNMTQADWDRHRKVLEAHLPFRHLEVRRPDAKGRAHWVSISGEPVFDLHGTFRGYRGVGRDTTKTKMAEEAREKLEMQLRQAQKMEALGTLAGGIAHDFNNILAAILGNAMLAREDLGASHPAAESLVEIDKAARRARDLVQQILAFSRQQSAEHAVVNLREVVEECGKLLRASLPAAVELSVTLAPDSPNVLGDRTQIHQVLMNLGTNAWHALDGRVGCIEATLNALNVTTGLSGDAPGAGLAPGRYAHLSVSDTGRGMDAPTLSRIFDPFFTTKPVGEGTGLGLAVVDGIVKSHGGAISVCSEPGIGTVFHLYFPAVDAGVEPAPVAAREQPRGDGQRILYLDDEEVLVIFAGRQLERLGYVVAGFTEAGDAFEAFKAAPDGFDLLVTDLNMPRASGLQVAKAFLELRPDLPVVLASGYLTDDLRAQAHSLGIREVIYKPNTVEHLAAAIHRLLAAQA